MKKIQFMDTSFRDGFQSVIGARVIAKDFLPALSAAMDAGTTYFEVAGGARFQSPFFYCGENAFDMMDEIRKTVGPDVNLQSLAWCQRRRLGRPVLRNDRPACEDVQEARCHDRS